MKLQRTPTTRLRDVTVGLLALAVAETLMPIGSAQAVLSDGCRDPHTGQLRNDGYLGPNTNGGGFDGGALPDNDRTTSAATGGRPWRGYTPLDYPPHSDPSIRRPSTAPRLVFYFLGTGTLVYDLAFNDPGHADERPSVGEGGGAWNYLPRGPLERSNRYFVIYIEGRWGSNPPGVPIPPGAPLLDPNFTFTLPPGDAAYDLRMLPGNEDVAVVHDIYENFLWSNVCFDDDKIYVAGFSHGGFMANALAQAQPFHQLPPGSPWSRTLWISGVGIRHGGIGAFRDMRRAPPQGVPASGLKVFIGSSNTDDIVPYHRSGTLWGTPAYVVDHYVADPIDPLTGADLRGDDDLHQGTCMSVACHAWSTIAVLAYWLGTDPDTATGDPAAGQAPNSAVDYRPTTSIPDVTVKLHFETNGCVRQHGCDPHFGSDDEEQSMVDYFN